MPEPAQGLADGGAPAPTRPAAAVIVLRGGDATLEVLLARRNPAARFMGGVWVFPGGAVDPHEGTDDAAHRLAAVRELEEEAGLRLPDPAALVPWARWITPETFQTRFDTWFYLAEAPARQTPVADGRECVAVAWRAPQVALDEAARGERPLVFPTRRQLEHLAGFPSARALLDWAPGREVVPVLPRVVGSGEEARVVLPGEPEYGG